VGVATGTAIIVKSSKKTGNFRKFKLHNSSKNLRRVTVAESCQPDLHEAIRCGCCAFVGLVT
jgi:hypothetical protein